MPIDRTISRSRSSEDRATEMAVRGALLRSGPIFVIPRHIYGGVAAALDGLSPEALPRLRFEGAVSDLRRQLRRAVSEHLAGPGWLKAWLIDDVVDKADMMAELTGAPALRVMLDVIDDDHACKFHIDDVRLRLLTTYRGPGTEYVPPRLAKIFAAGGSPSADAVCRLARGHIAVFRGGKDATPDRPGVLHRSPPIAGTGLVRLFLAIDEIGRRLQ